MSWFSSNRGPRAKKGHKKKTRKMLRLQDFWPPRLAPYHLYAVQGHTVAALHSYTHTIFLRFGGCESHVES